MKQLGSNPCSLKFLTHSATEPTCSSTSGCQSSCCCPWRPTTRASSRTRKWHFPASSGGSFSGRWPSGISGPAPPSSSWRHSRTRSAGDEPRREPTSLSHCKKNEEQVLFDVCYHWDMSKVLRDFTEVKSRRMKIRRTKTCRIHIIYMIYIVDLA